MTPLQHLIIAYVLALTLLWGYAIHLYVMHRRLGRRQQDARSRPAPSPDTATNL